MPPTKATLPVQENPVKALRGDLLQTTFAHQVGISRQALLRFEQGLIPDPSLKFKDFVTVNVIDREMADAWEDFVEEYHLFQHSKRQANYGILTDQIGFTGTQHPLKEWIEASQVGNLSQLCVALCLHLPIMYRFYNGPYPALPPDLIFGALAASGYDARLSTDFMLAYAEWRNSGSIRRAV